MSVRLFKPEPAQASELARICFDAFGTLQDRHGVERDFDQMELAEMVMGMLLNRPDFYGVAAEESGRIVGSNFLQLSDPVAAVGPITISPDAQSKGVGRMLMEAVVQEAQRRGVQRVRLQQEAINTTSLSLYTKLGFVWRDACALMKPAAAEREDPAVRMATEKDLDAIERISTAVYHSSRRNEVAAMLAAHFPVVVLERGGQVVGYHMPGFFGHGFAENATDMMTLINQSMRVAPPPMRKILLPLSQHELHVGLLERGAKTVKLFNYMTLGEWKRPAGAWVPSIGC